jgi:hypothetical protein
MVGEKLMDLESLRVLHTIQFSPQEKAWAIGREKVEGGQFHIRRVVWGRLMAREERRKGESLRRVRILIVGK